jgi:energy-coupling factor transporter ATP-binding protein EcfA2
MRIDRIRLQCFRQFQDKTLLFQDPVGNPLQTVVLAGPNGSGKTTFLEAFLIGLGRESLITRDMQPSDRKRYPRSALEDGTVIEIDLRSPGHLWTVARTTHEHFAREGIGENRWVRTEGANLGVLLNSFEIEYISSRRISRLVGPIQVSVKGRPPEDTESNRIWRLTNAILQQRIRRSDKYFGGAEPMDRVWLDHLNAFWSRFRQDGTYIELAIVDPADTQQTEWELFLYDGERRVCPLGALSSGELEAISLAASFITRPQPFQGLLLFDEPELHLHPVWQATVVPALREIMPEAQIIVSTHADDPWDQAHTYERFLLVPPTDQRSSEWRASKGAAQ